MTKNRLEAFSDGVIAIIITIMVLELKPPENAAWMSLLPLIPVFLNYILSFLYVGIYWNNHHHMLHTVDHVDGGILWANLHLLFWLSLIPATTAWMGQNHFASNPTALYGLNLLGCAIAYRLLQSRILKTHPNSPLHRAVGRDAKGLISVVLYILGICLGFVNNWCGIVAYAAVAILWIVPDRRIESTLTHPH